MQGMRYSSIDSTTAVVTPTQLMRLQIHSAAASGCTVSEPQMLDTYWEHPEFIRGGGHLGDGSW